MREVCRQSTVLKHTAHMHSALWDACPSLIHRTEAFESKFFAPRLLALLPSTAF